MPTIDDLLNTANPAEAIPPSTEQLRGIIGRRRARRRQAIVTGTAVVVALLVVGVAGLVGSGNGFVDEQQIDAVGEKGLDEGLRPDADGASDDDPSDTDADEAVAVETAESTDGSESGGQESETSPSATRWFLVPPGPTELRFISDQHLDLDTVQPGGRLGLITLTTDVSDPVTAGLAVVYHLEDTGLSVFRGRNVTVDGRVVRVESDPADDSVSAFVESGPGIFAVIGSSLAEEQAIALALAAELVDGQTDLSDRVPPGLRVVQPPDPQATDHSSNIVWGPENSRIELWMRPAPIEEEVLNRRYAGAPESVAVRATDGVYVPFSPGQDPAMLLWEEDGYTFTLTTTDDRIPVESEVLVETANALVRLDQPALVERFDSPFMRRQAATAQSWLEATPLPAGFDPTPLIHGIPQSELQLSSHIDWFLECAWFAEWEASILTDDGPRRAAAETVLADRPAWPVTVVHLGIVDGINRSNDRLERTPTHAKYIAEQQRLMTTIVTLDQLAELMTQYGCAFEVPE